MKKMNNKGFMMAEVIVVSSVVLVALTGLYISYYKVISAYQDRISYYDVNTLYKLDFYKSRQANFEINNNYEEITPIGEENEKCFLVNTNNIDKITTNNDKKLEKYLNYLKNTLDKNKKIMILEQCNGADCNYAYIDIEETPSSGGEE